MKERKTMHIMHLLQTDREVISYPRKELPSGFYPLAFADKHGFVFAVNMDNEFINLTRTSKDILAVECFKVFKNIECDPQEVVSLGSCSAL